MFFVTVKAAVTILSRLSSRTPSQNRQDTYYVQAIRQKSFSSMAGGGGVVTNIEEKSTSQSFNSFAQLVTSELSNILTLPYFVHLRLIL